MSACVCVRESERTIERKKLDVCVGIKGLVSVYIFLA